MFCRYCGTALPENGKFCPNCGQAQETASVPVQPVCTPEPAPAAYEPAPVQPEYTPVPAFVPAETPVEPPKKKKKGKRILISIIAAVLVLALVGGGLVYALVFNSPAYKLKKSLDKTDEAWSQLFSNCGNLKDTFAHLTALGESKQFTARISAEMDGEELSMQANLDEVNKQFSGTLATPLGESLSLYGDEEMLAFGVDKFLDENYYIPMKNLGDELVAVGLLDGDETETVEMLNKLNFFPESTLEKFKAEHQAQIDALNASLKIEETDAVISGAENLTVYSINMDWNICIDLMKDLMKEMNATVNGEDAVEGLEEIFEVFESENFRILVGVNEAGMATAFQVCSDDRTIGVVLDGKLNPWSVINTLSDGEIKLTVTIDPTPTGFHSGITFEGETLNIDCDDTAKTLSFSVDRDSFKLRYDNKNFGALFSFRLDLDYVNFAISFEVAPMEPVQPLTNPVNFLNLTQREMQDVLLDLLEALGMY